MTDLDKRAELIEAASKAFNEVADRQNEFKVLVELSHNVVPPQAALQALVNITYANSQALSAYMDVLADLCDKKFERKGD